MSAQTQTNFNLYVQLVASTSSYNVPQPLLMLKYAAPLTAPLYEAQYRSLIKSTGTQVKF